jgi:hypothetical protein
MVKMLFIGGGIWSAICSAIGWVGFWLRRDILLKYMKDHPDEGFPPDMCECRRQLFSDGKKGILYFLLALILLVIGFLIR